MEKTTKHNQDFVQKYQWIIVAFIIGLSIMGYKYLSNKQQQFETETALSKEKIKAEQIKQEQGQAKKVLDTCIADAEISSSNFWFNECKAKGLLTSRCISLHDMTFDEYAKQNNIPQDKRLDAIGTFFKEKTDCSCLLPQYNADRIDESLKRDKDDCFRKYPQN